MCTTKSAPCRLPSDHRCSYAKPKEGRAKGGLTWGFIRSKPDLFPQYCIKKPRQASALPWLFTLSCRKISRFGVLCSFEKKMFSHRNIQRTQKYWMYFKDDGFSVGKQIPSKPCKSLCESAHARPSFIIPVFAASGKDPPRSPALPQRRAGLGSYPPNGKHTH